MPTKIFFRYGGQAIVKGDTFDTAILIKRFKRMARTIGLTGHEVFIAKREIAVCDFIPEAEFLKHQEEMIAAAVAKEQAEKDAQEKAEQERILELRKAATEFIKEYGPNPGNWPTFSIPVRPLRKF
jgi:hypothetical protein